MDHVTAMSGKKGVRSWTSFSCIWYRALAFSAATTRDSSEWDFYSFYWVQWYLFKFTCTELLPLVATGSQFYHVLCKRRQGKYSCLGEIYCINVFLPVVLNKYVWKNMVLTLSAYLWNSCSVRYSGWEFRVMYSWIYLLKKSFTFLLCKVLKKSRPAILAWAIFINSTCTLLINLLHAMQYRGYWLTAHAVHQY